MTINSKKIIAKEIIIFTVFLIVTSFTLFIIWLNNYNKAKLKKEFVEVVEKLKCQQAQIPIRILPTFKEAMGLKPKFDPNKPYSEVPSLEEIESKSKYNLKKGDVVDFTQVTVLPDLDTFRLQREYIYNSISNDYDIGTLSEFMAKIEFPEKRVALYNKLASDGYNISTFAQFEKKLGFIPIELLNTSKSDFINYHFKMSYLNRLINKYNIEISEISIKSRTDLTSCFLQSIIISFIFFYPLRFLILALMWALKTLGSK